MMKKRLQRIVKDKLMKFDREHAKRTEVRDTQSDYYTSNNWLSEEEKTEAEKKEKLRIESKKRSNRPVNISIDLVGRRIVEHNEKTEASVEEENEAPRSEDDSIEDDLKFSYENHELLLSRSGSKAAELYRDLKARLTAPKQRTEGDAVAVQQAAARSTGLKPSSALYSGEETLNCG